MKKLVLFNVLIVLLLLQACNSNNKGKNYNISADSISSTDSMIAVKDTTRKLGFTLDNEDVRFTTEAASGSLTEIILGKIAQQKAKNKRIRNFGALMIKDHTKANNKLLALAQSKHVTLPTEPNAKDQQVIDELSKKSGEEFDKAYTAAMVADHIDDVKEFERVSQNSLDADVKKFAAKTLPVLKNHLDAINTINGSMK